MKLPLLLHEYKYASDINPPTLAPFEVDAKQLERYIEWRFLYHASVKESITETEFIQMPQKGLDKPDGFYKFSFDGGCFYVEVQDKQLRQISGYATSELSLFDAITREYGEALQEELQQTIQRAVDVEGVIREQVTEVQQRATEVQGEDKPNAPVDIQPD